MPRLVLLPLLALGLSAQTYRPPLAPPAAPVTPSPNPNQKVRAPRPDAPDPDSYSLTADDQEFDGSLAYLRGNARIETTDMLLTADQIDYDRDNGEAQARGHVHYEDFGKGDKFDCEKGRYNTKDQTGRFEQCAGTHPAQVKARPGLLTTTNPYYFQAKWVEKLKDLYVLHQAFLTDCEIPNSWWVLKGPKFDLVPNDYAIAHNSWFYLKRFPLFYTPFFYKSLKKEPRKSGFLIPNVGTSSLHGTAVGFGYYWAINRSYDLTYRGQFYSEDGLAHHVDFRGKVNDRTGFDLTFFGIKDTKAVVPSVSGLRVGLNGESVLGKGWEARGTLDYLSSFAFLQNFTQSYNEAVSSETHSVGFVTKHWSDYGIDIVTQRNVNFQSAAAGDTTEMRKLPEVNFTKREHEIDLKSWPVWFSFDSSAGLMDRSQPLFQTRQFVDRLDFAPHVTTAFRWRDIQLLPTFGIRETAYGSSFVDGKLTGASFLRSSRDVAVDLVLPSLERVFKAPSWLEKMAGEKVKHVIEPRIGYRYVTGVDDFQRTVRFDENDLLTNTNQVEFSLTNRLLAKDKNGTVTDFLTWQLRYDRYFDPTFGGAIVPGQRNVIDSEIALTGYAFITGPRNYSPVVSVIRVQSRVGLEWRADYDPLIGGLSNSSINVDGRIDKYYWSVGHTDVKLDPVSASQLRTRFGYGSPSRRGWNSTLEAFFDYRKGSLQYWQTQVAYNTDCCGISVQYRRFSVGTRSDSQFEAAFLVSNIGSFGTLRKQERIF